MPAMTLPQAFALAFDHHRAGRLAEAEALYRQILAVQPAHADSLHFLGIIAAQSGQNAEAAALIERAIAAMPGVATYHANLGEAYRHLGCLDDAIVEYRRAIQLQPDFAACYSNLGVAFRQQGRLGEAIEAYRQALTLDPANADICNNLGVALSGLGASGAAIEAYKRALRIDPDCTKILNNLGAEYCLKGQFAEAVAVLNRAVCAQPDFANAYGNLGAALHALHRLDAAAAAYREAARLNPASALAQTHFANALRDQGLLEEAVAHYRRAVELQPDLAALHSNLVYATHFLPGCDRSAQQAERARWNAMHGARSIVSRASYTNDPDPARRLKIGYVSPDFCDHVIGRNLLPLFAHHDRSSFEIFCYSDAVQPDEITQRFGEMSDHWRPIRGFTDDVLAAQIRADGVDVLVDLTQHMAGNRLRTFALQPAPVQISFAGYPDSTGLAAIGDRISDRYLEDEASGAGERVWRIDSFWCYDPCGVALEVAPLPARERGTVTFGCLNTFCKINPPVLALWAQILQRVPGSRLLMLSAEGGHRERVAQDLVRLGVERERVEFVGHQPRADYLALYHQIDVVLDVFPYNGHTTSLDALWMGVPVVSLVGETPVARAGWSILQNLGLPELVAHTDEDYVARAVALASDLPRLAALRAGLRARMEKSVLMDARNFARQIEDVYRGAWRAWCESA